MFLFIFVFVVLFLFFPKAFAANDLPTRQIILKNQSIIALFSSGEAEDEKKATHPRHTTHRWFKMQLARAIFRPRKLRRRQTVLTTLVNKALSTDLLVRLFTVVSFAVFSIISAYEQCTNAVNFFITIFVSISIANVNLQILMNLISLSIIAITHIFIFW